MAINAGENLIDSTYLTKDSMAVKAVDNIGDMIIGAFDNVMTKAVNEGGIADACGKVVDVLSNTADKMLASTNLPHPDTSHAKAPDSNEIPAPQLSRSQELTVCPGGAEVAAQVSNSGLNLQNFKAASMVHVPEAALTGQNHDFNVSQSAMIAPTAQDFHQQAEQLSV